jgi:hypothetical protein
MSDGMGSLWGPFTETVEERRKKLDELFGPWTEKIKKVRISPEALREAMERADERVEAFRSKPSCGCCPCCMRF